MNTLLKIAFGAVVAGAVTAVLLKRRAARSVAAGQTIPSTAGLGRVPAGSQGLTVEELTDENREWGGGSAGLTS